MKRAFPALLLVLLLADGPFAGRFVVPASGQESLIVRSKVRVNPRGFLHWPLTVESYAPHGRITGNATAFGGFGDNIRVLVMTEGQFHAWRAGERTYPLYDSGKQSSIELDFPLSEPGKYSIVLDNGFSLVSPKEVTADIRFVRARVGMGEALGERRPTDQELRAGQILGRLIETLRAMKWGAARQFATPLSLHIAENPGPNSGPMPEKRLIIVNRGVLQFADLHPGKTGDILSAMLAHELSHLYYRHSKQSPVIGGVIRTTPQVTVVEERVGKTPGGPAGKGGPIFEPAIGGPITVIIHEDPAGPGPAARRGGRRAAAAAPLRIHPFVVLLPALPPQELEDVTQYAQYGSYDEDQEFEAHLLAIRLVCAAGFDPEAILLAIWKTSEEQQPLPPNYLVAPRRRVGQLLSEALQCKSRLDISQVSTKTRFGAAGSASCRGAVETVTPSVIGRVMVGLVSVTGGCALQAPPGVVHEMRATSTLRTINTAQTTFAETYQRGFTESLNQLGPAASGQPSLASAGLVEPLPAGLCLGGTGNSFYAWGYRFEYTPGPGGFGGITAYTLTARPIVPRSTGVRSFFTDQSGIIRYTCENRPATAEDTPI